MFVDISNAIFPDAGFPFTGRQCVFKDSTIPVDSSELTSFFFYRHLPEKIFYPFVDRLGSIFVDIFLAVLIQVDPAFVIYFFLIFGRMGHGSL